MSDVISTQLIEQKILFVRGQKVMLDRDLAHLYGIETRDLNKAVVRNRERFPDDFMFELTPEEFKVLMFQFGTSSWGGTRKMPKVFTEHGILMLSSVLRSTRAVAVNIQIMRTFVKLRRMLESHKDLWRKVEDLERKYDGQFKFIFDALKRLTAPDPEKKKRPIGFIVDREGES